MSKIKDLFDVVKYRKKLNTLINNYDSTQDKYVKLLEKDRTMLDENTILKAKLVDANKEIKELKIKLEEK